MNIKWSLKSNSGRPAGDAGIIGQLNRLYERLKNHRRWRFCRGQPPKNPPHPPPHLICGDFVRFRGGEAKIIGFLPLFLELPNPHVKGSVLAIYRTLAAD